MDPKELIAALGVLANASASDEDKAAALDKLSAYFNSMLDSQESTDTEGASETGTEDDDKSKEKTSEAGDEDKEPSKEMASALATIEALTDRVGKLEKASAVGLAPRGTRPTPLKRVDPKSAPTLDPHSAVAISMIEKAGKNTIGMLGK